MKISIERDILLKGLNHVHSVVERRNTIPVLSNVKIKADDEGISLTATDLDLEIIENLKANTLDAGITTTSAHTLYDIVRKLPEGSQIDIEKNDELLFLEVRDKNDNKKKEAFTRVGNASKILGPEEIVKYSEENF